MGFVSFEEARKQDSASGFIPFDSVLEEPKSGFVPFEEEEDSYLKKIGKKGAGAFLTPVKGVLAAERIKERAITDVTEAARPFLPEPAGTKEERARAIAEMTGRPYEPPVEKVEEKRKPSVLAEGLKERVGVAEKFWEADLSEAPRYVQLLGQASESLGAMASTLPIGGLKLLASTSGLLKAEEALKEGADLPTALFAGGVVGFTEWATELDPTKTLMKPGISFLTRLGKGLVADIPGELIATATEMALVDEKILGKKHTAEEYERALWDTAAVAGLVTTGATAATHPVVGRDVEGAAQEIPITGAQPGPAETVPSHERLTPEALEQITRGAKEEVVPPKRKSGFIPLEQPTAPPTGQQAETGFYTETTEKPLLEMPEIVEFAKEINEGKYPGIKDRLGKKYGELRSTGGPLGKADITLKADIFAGDLINQEVVKPKDADADFKAFKELILEDPEVKEQDVIFRKEYDRKTKQVNLKAYRRNPQFAANVLAHEVGHLVDYLDDKDLKRGNVLGRIKSLKKHMIQTIDKAPAGISKVLTPKDKGRLRRRAIEIAGTKPEVGSAEHQVWRETVKSGYDALVKSETTTRGLITRNEIMDELKSLSQARKPFDDTANPKYTKYRYSAPELYADAVSAMVNTPQLFKDKAPKFRESFFAYMGNKPNVKEVYDGILARGEGGRASLVNDRVDKVYNMLGEGDIARQKLNERNLEEVEGIKDTLTRWLVDKYHSSLKHVRIQERVPGEIGDNARKARYDLEEVQYIASEAENYLFNVYEGILGSGREQGVTTEDVGFYMFANRIANERGDIANPLGHTQESAAEMLRALPQRWGPEKFNAVVGAVDQYRKVREDLIMPKIEASGLFTPELIETIKNNPDYAKFSVHKFLEDKHGSGTTAKIYKQIGTLSEVENPFIATVMQDLSLLRAAAINTSKDSLVTALDVAGVVKPADMKYSQDVNARVPVEPKDPKQGILTVMVEGKPQHHYTSAAIVDTFKYAPLEATWAARAWTWLTQPLRELFVNKNPLWMARNVIRDFRATVKNNPEVRLRDTARLLADYKVAIGEAWSDVMKGEKSKDIQTLLREKALLSDRAYAKREMTFDDELERLAAQYNIKEDTEAKGARVKLKKVWAFLDKLGKISERTGKVAGYKYLKNRTDISAKDMAHRVRTRVGTPDVKRQGSLQQLTNNLFMFSNVGKEGLRSSWKSYKDDPAGYVWKTVITNVLPKLALIGAGLYGNDRLKEVLEGIPDYDKKHYTVIPLWLTDDGKSIYLRIPEDYQGQIIGSLVWDLVHGRIAGQDGAIKTAAEASPYKVHPLVEVGGDMFQYYINGNNPQDEYRGRPVIPDVAFRAGGAEAHKAMAKYAWKGLGGRLLYEPTYALNREVSKSEKLLKTFPFNILGEFIKISDRGKAERLDSIVEDIRQRGAEAALDRQMLIKHGINEDVETADLMRDLRDRGLLTRQVRNQLRAYRGLAIDNPYVNALAMARGLEERRALLKEYREVLSREEFAEVIELLRGRPRNNKEDR